MKLGYYYHLPALRKQDGLYMPGYQAVFVERLARHFERIVCFMPSPASGEAAMMDCRIKARNVSLCSLGEHQRAILQILFGHQIAGRVRQQLREVDLLLLRGPSPLLKALASRAPHIPLALLLVGDYEKGISSLACSGLKRLGISMWSRWNRSQQNKLCRRALTFVNNRPLFHQLEGVAAKLVEVRTSTFGENDFFYREDTCRGQVIRLLYTGRMDSAKGLEDILEAVILLSNKGVSVRWDLVGPLDPRDRVLERVFGRARDAGVSERVFYHGYVPLGPQLWNYYREADFFVTASRSSEGFPRAISEAFSQGLPVIATDVGSISEYASGSVAFAEIKNPESLAAAILSIMRDPEKRREMICSGRLLAEKSLLDVQVEAMVHEMERWVSEYDKKN